MFTLKQLCQSGTTALWLSSTLVAAWTTPDLAVDLTWPPLDTSGYFTQNGGQTVNSDPSPFPCANTPPPSPGSPRTDFPVSGASLQLDFTNTSSPSQYVDWTFDVNVYLGQFGSSVTSNLSEWTYLSTAVVGNETGRSVCLDPVNITAKALEGSPVELRLDSADVQNLVGADVTLGLRVVLFDAASDNQQEMYQCSYLRLVADDAPVIQTRGVCNTGPSPTGTPATPTGTSTPAPSGSSTDTATATSTSTPPPPGSAFGNGGAGHSFPLGKVVAVCVVVGTALLALGCCVFLYVRRRRARKPKGTMALGFWVAGREDGGAEEIGGEKEKEKGKSSGVEEHVAAWEGKGKGEKEGDDGGAEGSSRGSVHSEPLPVYQPEGARSGGGDQVEK